MNSLLDDVNALLKLKQGDLGRLEHIKKTLEEGNMLYISDSKYLQELTREYLKNDDGNIFKKSNPYDYPEYANRIKDTESAKNKHVSSNNDEIKAEKVEEIQTEKVEHIENVFCWKCGTKNPEYAQFCSYCGSSIHNVETKRVLDSSEMYSPKHTPKTKKDKGIGIGKKLLIGLGVLFIVIVIGGITIGGIIIGSIGMTMNEEQEFKDKLFEGMTDEGKAAYSSQIENCKNNMAYLKSDEAGQLVEKRCMSSIINSIEQQKITANSEVINSKCGTGTVFDEDTNTCIVK